MTKLSVVIITFNEEKNIARCLDSIESIADDIIVVDSFSTDQTKQICSQFNVRFIQHEFEGHIEQKNWALQQAKYPHVLSLDADEALTEPLQTLVRSIKENWTADGYTMNRLTNYCGQWIKHCGWYPDRKLRQVNPPALTSINDVNYRCSKSQMRTSKHRMLNVSPPCRVHIRIQN